MRDSIHVDAASGEIRGDQYSHLAVAESVEHAGACRLRLVSVDRLGAQPVLVQLFGDSVGSVLGPSEDQGAAHRGFPQQSLQQFPLVHLLDEQHALFDAFHGRGRWRHGDSHGCAQQAGCQVGRRRRQCR